MVFKDLDKGKSQEERKYLMGREIENGHVSEESEAPPLQFQESALTIKETFVNKVSEPFFTDVVASIACDYESDSLPAIAIENKSGAASVTTENLHVELNESEKPNHELGEEVESTGYLFGLPVREELHTFYEETQQAKSLTKFNGLKQSASNAPVLEGNTITSLMRGNNNAGSGIYIYIYVTI